MPQLDLDHIFCVGARGHGDSDSAGAAQRGGDASASARADDGDAPAESVLIPVRGGTGLAELLCTALRRDGSTKGRSNPKAAAEAEAASRKQGAPRADSRRLAAGSKTAVAIGILPAAGKVVANSKERRAPGRVVARAWRRPAAGARVFASEAVGPEPVSPKVSCFGAVLPESRAAAGPPGNKQGEEEERGGCWSPGNKQREEEERGGCWSSVAAELRGLCCSSNNSPREGEPVASESSPQATTAPEPQTVPFLSSPRAVAGLGDVKRLASRRWPETMAAEGRGSV
ncbi:hypothetical protein PAHAL_7G139600 [Panicum hallii]|jgi:hypothetical protein|uniref:Uncharacterized protein n=1 Tax=Panicum hallii TaxID=206008 RepID=A0A2S3I6C5_9POAL|nr:uncharacterized protein LOC112900684 [Panicum hallii]PAN38007.1 hypothetical protein PAHAL_7G139600 [Panicum hallii]